jgi:hypothetical protein
MSPDTVKSSDGSTAIGGDVTAPVVNVNSGDRSQVQITINQEIQRKLSTLLGSVIVFFAEMSLNEYGMGRRTTLPPEVSYKLKHNAFENSQIMEDWTMHSLDLERAYAGVEQQNPDVRYLVHRKARYAYANLVEHLPKEDGQSRPRLDYVRQHAKEIVQGVVGQLMLEYEQSNDKKVQQEPADLAISLVVADALIACDVLEGATDAITP